jgi:hypothetical protein
MVAPIIEPHNRLVPATVPSTIPNAIALACSAVPLKDANTGFLSHPISAANVGAPGLAFETRDSSFLHYATGIEGRVEIESEWTAARRGARLPDGFELKRLDG